MKKKAPDHREVLKRFCIRFLLLCIALYFLINWVPSRFIEPINVYTARMCGLLLGILGLSTHVHGPFVTAGGFSVKIITECSAVFVCALFSSFVLAYPASPRDKAFGLVFGLPLLFLVNLLRLLIVFLVGLRVPALFQAVHIYLGQIMMVLFLILACLIWLRTCGRIPLKETPFVFLARAVLFSATPFSLWLLIDDSYVALNTYGARVLLNLFGLGLPLSWNTGRNLNTYASFSLVAFATLVIATRSLDLQTKLRGLLFGSGALAVVYFLYEAHKMLYAGLSAGVALIPFVGLIIANQWVLPFALWLFLVRRDLFRQASVN